MTAAPSRPAMPRERLRARRQTDRWPASAARRSPGGDAGPSSRAGRSAGGWVTRRIEGPALWTRTNCRTPSSRVATPTASARQAAATTYAAARLRTTRPTRPRLRPSTLAPAATGRLAESATPRKTGVESARGSGASSRKTARPAGPSGPALHHGAAGPAVVGVPAQPPDLIVAQSQPHCAGRGPLGQPARSAAAGPSTARRTPDGTARGRGRAASPPPPR